MAKYTVNFPDGKKFTGTYLSVLFAGGEAQTDSDYMAERFRAKGLTVTENAPAAEEPAGEDAPADPATAAGDDTPATEPQKKK